MQNDAIPKAALIAAMQKAARQAVLPRFRSLAPGDVSQKSGPMDLVTVADTEAEAIMIADLARAWPEARVLGEESVAKDASLRTAMVTADPCVILDPVDGTWNFAHGVSVFGMLLAVTRAGRPTWGVIYDPLLDDWVESDGQESWLVTAKGRHRLGPAKAKPANLWVGYLPLGLYSRAGRTAGAMAGVDYARLTTLRCSAHEYRQLALGHVDFVISGPVPHPWDHLAGALAVQGMGGVCRFLDGAPYDMERPRGTLVSAVSEEVWQKVARDFAGLAQG